MADVAGTGSDGGGRRVVFRLRVVETGLNRDTTGCRMRRNRLGARSGRGNAGDRIRTIEIRRETLVDVQIRLFGGVAAATDDGEPVDVGPAKCQAVLAVLALSPGSAVPVSRIVRLVWGEEPPRTADKTLQSYVTRPAQGPRPRLDRPHRRRLPLGRDGRFGRRRPLPAAARRRRHRRRARRMDGHSRSPGSTPTA